MTFQIIVIQVLSRHATKRAASAALRKLSDKHGEIAMVIEVPDEKSTEAKEKRR